ncbi:uncharacterized protein V2V93DRAFT_381590 [Kockiozyma suomiensis]|uniref:uncharacterized protein n=1 Tax=Kockiozyma suomiensis TaxID=1337062 RepID=UPI003343ECDC
MLSRTVESLSISLPRSEASPPPYSAPSTPVSASEEQKQQLDDESLRGSTSNSNNPNSRSDSDSDSESDIADEYAFLDNLPSYEPAAVPTRNILRKPVLVPMTSKSISPRLLVSMPEKPSNMICYSVLPEEILSRGVVQADFDALILSYNNIIFNSAYRIKSIMQDNLSNRRQSYRSVSNRRDRRELRSRSGSNFGIVGLFARTALGAVTLATKHRRRLQATEYINRINEEYFKARQLKAHVVDAAIAIKLKQSYGAITCSSKRAPESNGISTKRNDVNLTLEPSDDQYLILYGIDSDVDTILGIVH